MITLENYFNIEEDKNKCLRPNATLTISQAVSTQTSNDSNKLTGSCYLLRLMTFERKLN